MTSIGSKGGVEEALDKGYSCTEEWVTLTDESVTTAIAEGNPFANGEFAYSESITADTIKVTFNGTEYTCNKRLEDGENFYGAELSETTQGFDFSTYPFAIGSSDGSSYLYTETAGTYQVKIEAFEEIVETSECFRKAVEESTQPLFVSMQLMSNGGRLITPFIDIYNSFRQGRRVIAYISNAAFEITSVYRDSLGGGRVVVDGRTYTASADDAYPSYSSESGGGSQQ